MTKVINKHTAYTQEYGVASVDCGTSGPPGSYANKNKCSIDITKDNRWVARSSYSSGSNQGYYQEDYSYGPWEGRGDTPDEAIASMLSRVDSDNIQNARQSAHDAKIAAEKQFGSRWKTMTWFEFAIHCQTSLLKSEYQSKKYSPFQDKADEGIDDWREAEIKRLKKAYKSSLAHLSDQELLAECRLRGLA